MLNKKSLTVLAFLVLGTSVLTGCPNSSRDNNSGENPQSQQVPGDEKTSSIFRELNNEYQKVETLIKKFIEDIEGTNSLKNAKKINSNKAIKAVRELNQKAKKYQENNNLKDIIKNIDTITQDINKYVLLELKCGIKKESINKTIKKLNEIGELNINVQNQNQITNDEWKNFKSEVIEYLSNKLSELKKPIEDIKKNETQVNDQLTKEIQKETENNKAEISSLDSKVTNNSTKISEQTKDIEESKNDINNINSSMNINNLVTGINLLLLIIILLILLNNIFDFIPQINKFISTQTKREKLSEEEMNNLVKAVQQKINGTKEDGYQPNTETEIKATREKVEEIEKKQQTMQTEINNIKVQLPTPQEATATTIGSDDYDDGQKSEPEPIKNPKGEEEMSGTTSPTPQPAIDKSKLDKDSLVNIYNNDAKRLFDNAIEVEESEDTINQRRAGSNVSPVLIKSQRKKGICWIIQIQGILYLVPKANLIVNEFRSNTIKALFDCQNYQKGYSEDFILEKPAEVVSSGEDSWTLKEQGRLKFESSSS